MKDAEEFYPKDKKAWRKWLELNHRDKDAVWVIFHKVKSPKHNLSWSDSVDEALCFGWIDSTKRSLDDERFIQYFSKRKAKSNWSKINKDKVKVLIEQNLMAEAGYESIAIAKENGSWTLLDNVEALIVPEDLTAAFTKHKTTKEFYDSLSNSKKKTLLYWLNSAKRKATREKRITEIIESANKGFMPKRFW
ncbi:MAG: YdeI/OmpD-associated family protein [Vicingaceae bacterium]